MRLDKFLSATSGQSRSRVKDMIASKVVKVNGAIVSQKDYEVNMTDVVTLFDKPQVLYENRYFVLNKPQGVVSATIDTKEQTVMQLFHEPQMKDYFPVGRLDKDTVGMLLITNDGAFNHLLMSPKKHISKTYLVRAKYAISELDQKMLEEGINIGDEKLTLPAKVTNLQDENTLFELTIYEGRYHQIKRMLHAIGNEVVALKRIAMGGLAPDPSLEEGQYRELTSEELRKMMGE